VLSQNKRHIAYFSKALSHASLKVDLRKRIDRPSFSHLALETLPGGMKVFCAYGSVESEISLGTSKPT